MKVLLRTLTRIMGSQLGILAKAQFAYPKGRASGPLEMRPLKGWNGPVYGSVSWYFDFVCRVTISEEVTEVRFKRMWRTVASSLAVGIKK
jgi:hypothetical protein